MRVAFLLVAAIATKTISAEEIFIRRNDGSIVGALFGEEASMLSEYMVSLSFHLGGMTKSKAEKSVGNGDSSVSMGKAAKDSKLTKSNKVGSMMSMGKTCKMTKSGKDC